MIWVSNSMLVNTKKVDILPKFLSDHNPVVWIFRNKRKVHRWRLNEEVFEKEENVEYLKKEIDKFFEWNWDNEVKNSIVWDSFKAYMRGLLTALNAKERKLRDKAMKELQDKIKEKWT